MPTFEELLLPPVMKELADSSRGLVLLTGPTGTGKTTTIASVIGYINRTRRAHIVTIEDPIEVVHEDDLSMIQQREIGLLAYRHLAHLEKVASLVPPDKLTRVSEAAARSQGMELKVFTNLPDAMEWLME